MNEMGAAFRGREISNNKDRRYGFDKLTMSGLRLD
jgi:hypothetical protein